MVRLTVCRGCCCGTAKAVPDLDHEEQLTRVASLAAQAGASWRVSECLGPCEEANVIVVHPAPDARASGARPVWLGRIAQDQIDAVRRWVKAGGPGHSALPTALLSHVLARPQRL